MTSLLFFLAALAGSQPDGVRAEVTLGDRGASIVSADPDGNVVIGGRGDDDVRVEGALNRVDGGGGRDRIHFGRRTGQLHLAAAVRGARSVLLIDAPFSIDDLKLTYLSGALYIELPPGDSGPASTAIVYGVGQGAPAVSSVRVGGRTFSIGQLRARAPRP